MITYERLREVLDYNPITGVFVWKISPANHVKSGSIAGGRVVTTGYIKIIIDKKAYLAHRLAWLYMTGTCLRVSIIDHKNRIVDDNRWENLRLCSRSQNRVNSKLSINSTTGYKNISVVRRYGKIKYRARTKKDGKEYYLGSFDTLEEAVTIAKASARQLHGEFTP